MGTRAIVNVLDEDGKKIIEMYKQFDGYPDGLGVELQAFINSGELVNGSGTSDGRQFNGMECFAAQLVEHYKDGAGDIYLHAPTTKYLSKKKYANIYYAEYYYSIDSNLNLRCWDTYENKEVFLDQIK